MLHIGTRFYGKNPEKDLPRISSFVESASKIGRVHVAVNTDEDTIGSLEFIKDNFSDVDAFSVTPWQRFVAPLNAIVYRAIREEAINILFASAEFQPNIHQVEALAEHMGRNILVAGARFSEHEFSTGCVPGTGVTVPWNTFALWNANMLGRVGFPLVGDAPFDNAIAGVEEVAAIAVGQRLYGWQAKLVSIPEFYSEWNTEGWDAERLAKHAAKIASKVARPKKQLEWAEIPTPKVIHIA